MCQWCNLIIIKFHFRGKYFDAFFSLFSVCAFRWTSADDVSCWMKVKMCVSRKRKINKACTKHCGRLTPSYVHENVQYGTARASSMNTWIVSALEPVFGCTQQSRFLMKLQQFFAVHSEQLNQLKHEHAERNVVSKHWNNFAPSLVKKYFYDSSSDFFLGLTIFFNIFPFGEQKVTILSLDFLLLTFK